MGGTPARADGSGRQLASYYDRHMALLDGVVEVAAGNTATIALRADGSLLQWDGGVGLRRLRVTWAGMRVGRCGLRPQLRLLEAARGSAQTRTSCEAR